jgi:hypothetical protein
MGKCILQFDQIEIINQKSASGQFDNDWPILHWFAPARSHRFRPPVARLPA